MRRIASALSARRHDKPDAQHSPDDGQSRPSSTASPPSRKSSRRFFGTLARITVSTERPTQLSEPAHSSSASSTGSVSLRTPEDDRTGHLAPPGGRSGIKKAWVPWLTPKKSDLQPPSSQRPSSVWSDSLSPSPPTHPVPSRIIPDQQTESDDEDTSEESSSSESDSPLRPPLTAAKLNRPLAPIAFLQAFTESNISPPFSPPPLLHYPNIPVFPRSSNRSRSLPFRGSMESVMHRNRLLARLQRGHLTPADQRILATVGSRAPSAAERQALTQPEEGERYDLRHVRPSSLGLRQWVTRPYFEERFVVWVPDEAGTVVWTTVKGSGFGVWALEVSDTLELLAGPTDVEDPLPIGTLATSSPNNSAVSSASLSAVGKQAPYKTVPSPLGRDDRPSDPPISSSSPEPMAPASTPIISSSRRGVRFAESVDKEDQVPLSYILRHRKRREEKTLFLQQERERREHEEEKRRHEAERQQWEQEKRQWQKEKRTIEEAKRQKQYAEELNAARVRRESLYALPSSQAREQGRKPREAYSRPVYDSRRQTESPSQNDPHLRNDSSSGSRQGSFPRSESGGPRPTSANSFTSSEDVRTRVSRNSRRGSVVSESSQRSFNFPPVSYGWPPVPPLPQVLPIPVFPAMPMMPQFPVDMPLLPPAAPFMRQQYERSHSRGSSPLRGTGQSHSAERPRQSVDSGSPPPNHRRSSSDDYVGGKSGAPSHTLTNNSPAPRRPLYPMHASSSDIPRRASVSPSMHRQPYAPRRQTAIS